MKKHDGFNLGDLPYPYTELEPYISCSTLYYHHDFHHRGYVNNLNNALAKAPNFYRKNPKLDQIILNYRDANEHLQAAIKNNAGGHLNHEMFWEVMCNHKKEEANLANFPFMKKQLVKHFESVEKFTEQFQTAAVKLFGSGWVWLAYSISSEKLLIVSTNGHNNPISLVCIPILVIDVWEHAYYLDYKNNRTLFVKNFFKIINWKKVEYLYKNAVQQILINKVK